MDNGKPRGWWDGSVSKCDCYQVCVTATKSVWLPPSLATQRMEGENGFTQVVLRFTTHTQRQARNASYKQTNEQNKKNVSNHVVRALPFSPILCLWGWDRGWKLSYSKMANDLVDHAELMRLPEKPNKTWALGFQEDEQEDIHMLKMVYPSSVGLEALCWGPFQTLPYTAPHLTSRIISNVYYNKLVNTGVYSRPLSCSRKLITTQAAGVWEP